MSSRVSSRGQLAVTNENLHIHRKEPGVDLDTKSVKTAMKKSGAAFGNRKALNDITNKSSVRQDVSLKRNCVPKEEFNVAEERFLHDHDKCIEEQQTALSAFMLNLVLPGRDSVSFAGNSVLIKDDLDRYPEPEELPVPEFSNLFKSSWDSNPCSPFHLDSTPSSPLAWHVEEVEFTLKQVDDDGVV